MILDSVKPTALIATDMEQDWDCISIVGPFPAVLSPNTTKTEGGGVRKYMRYSIMFGLFNQ